MKPKSPSPDPAPPRMPVRENQPDLTPLPIDDGKTDPPLPIREHPDGGRAPPDPIRRAATPATPAVPATAGYDCERQSQPQPWPGEAQEVSVSRIAGGDGGAASGANYSGARVPFVPTAPDPAVARS